MNLYPYIIIMWQGEIFNYEKEKIGMKNMFKKIQPTVMMVWNKVKKTVKTVSLAVTYFVQGVVKSLMTSLCILAGVTHTK